MKSPFIRVLLAISPDHLEKHFKDTLIYGNREYGAKMIRHSDAPKNLVSQNVSRIETPGSFFNTEWA